MKKKNRREFLTQIGLAGGTMIVGNTLLRAFPAHEPAASFLQSTEKSKFGTPIDFRYQPAVWQSTYCFPHDPHKSLVNHLGGLLYGYQSDSSFISTIDFRIAEESPEFVSQSTEAPGIPIIVTHLRYANVNVRCTSFASKSKDEGRLDNLLVEITPREGASAEVRASLKIASTIEFTLINEDEGDVERDRVGVLYPQGSDEAPFLVVDSPLEKAGSTGVYQLMAGTATEAKPLRYVVRVPLEGQDLDKIVDGFENLDKILIGSRTYWQQWNHTGEKVGWTAEAEYHPFLVAGVRDIVQAAPGDPAAAPDALWQKLDFVDQVFIAEALHISGRTKEAKSLIDSIWNRQSNNHLFASGSGHDTWRETGAVVFGLARYADLTQDWDYFNELYPGAYEALNALRVIRDSGPQDGSLNARYGILPRREIAGMPGLRSEILSTLWASIAAKSLLGVADRLFQQRRSEIRDFYRELRVSVVALMREQIRKDTPELPYLPALLPDDPAWNDPALRPEPQFGQIDVAATFYPGLFLKKDDQQIKNHFEIIRNSMKNEIPAGTGIEGPGTVVPFHAPLLAQTFLWGGVPEFASKIFRGFLNHASPLHGWSRAHPKPDSPSAIADAIPDSRASAECLRYLRAMMILEDEDRLRILDGITEAEIRAGKPMSVENSPTQWGLVSLSIEPLDHKRWSVKFRRDVSGLTSAPTLKYIDAPRKLMSNLAFEKLAGATVSVNGPRVLIDPTVTSWEAVWFFFR